MNLYREHSLVVSRLTGFQSRHGLENQINNLSYNIKKLRKLIKTMIEPNLDSHSEAELFDILEDGTYDNTTAYSRWIYLICPLITLVLSSSFFWVNSSQMQQASHEVKTAVYSDYLSLIRPRAK